MRKSVIFLIIILAVVLSCYIISNCVVKKGEGSIIIARDLKTDDLTLLKNGNNFIWQGAIPGRVVFYTISSQNMNTFNLSMKTRLFEDLNDNIYSIKISLNIVYNIDEKTVLNFYRAQLERSGNSFNDLIEKFLKGNFEGELATYISPRYRRDDILREKDQIAERIINRLKNQCQSAGINISSYEIIGGITLPEGEIFNEGLNYCRELRENEKNNKKELIILNGQLEREKLFNKLYFDKLSEISKLISGTPALLKYIYIDKMADKVKVIVAPENSGLPFGLDSDDSQKRQKNSVEIDNLK